MPKPTISDETVEGTEDAKAAEETPSDRRIQQRNPAWDGPVSYSKAAG